MANFNLNDYETVKERKERFYKDHKDGRIIVKLINDDMSINEYALFKVSIYFEKDDTKPKATGYAMEIRDKKLSISNAGNQYESVNYSSWCENCEESAVGRALDNAGYSGNKKCSREEMEKANRMTNTLKNQPFTGNEYSNPTKQVKAGDKCPKCGADMILNPKTGKMFCKDKCWLKK